MRVLVTRPEHDARRTAERLKTLGHEPVIDSLLVIEALPFTAPLSDFDAVAITSANALLAGEALSRFFGTRLIAVGAHSAEAARAAGFRDVTSGEGDVRALAKLLNDMFLDGARILYLGGEQRAQNLAALVDPRLRVETHAVYRAVAAQQLGESAMALRAGAIDAVLHYSPRSAEIFLSLVKKEELLAGAAKARHLCFSDAVAAPLRAAELEVKVAAEPREDALLALLA
jgi:uroporphyrinogen-III synthase